MVLFVSLLIAFALHLSGVMTIAGGREAIPHSKRYLVSFQINKEHLCGGMLIRNNYVLTSAHCLNGYKPSEKKRLDVVLGAHSISQNARRHQRIQVKKYIKHPLYNEGTKDWSYDIMLLKLQSQATLNKFVDIIALPKENETIPARQKCSIAGWGAQVPNNHQASRVLREVTLMLQFNLECKNLWKDYFDSKYMICTSSDGIRAFCQGDSGSPLMCNNMPYAIATYTHSDCTHHKFPGVYIKIAYFMPWINQVIKY